MSPRRAKAHPLSGSVISQYGSQSKALERGFFWILILLRRMFSKQSPAPIGPWAPLFRLDRFRSASLSRSWARAHPLPPSLRTILPKLVPGQLLSIAVRRRYDRKQRRVLDSHSQPAQQPGPEKIGCNQPGWLLRVNPASENDEDTVGCRCGAPDHVAIPTKHGRVDDEHAADWRGRANRWRSFHCFLGYRNREVLANKELSNSYLDIFLIGLTLTPNRPYPLESKCERNQ